MKTIYLVLICVIIVSCNKPKKITPIPPTKSYLWSDYMGTYDVYDTINNTQWVMKMTHIYHSDYNNGNEDSIFIENFANKFNIRYKWHPTISDKSKKSGFGIGPFHPIYDYSLLRWHLAGWWDDTTTQTEENVLKNDSLTLFFSQSNIAFYQTDGVPYYDCDCKHIAVKRK